MTEKKHTDWALLRRIWPRRRRKVAVRVQPGSATGQKNPVCPQAKRHRTSGQKKSEKAKPSA